MGIPIKIAGLDVLLRELPAGQIALVEGGRDPAKRFFAQNLAHASKDAGRQMQEIVTLSDGAGEHVLEWQRLEDTLPEQDLSVDSFSFLARGASDDGLVAYLTDLRRHLVEVGGSAILSLDDGMLDTRRTSLIDHFADGVVRFESRHDEEGSKGFLHIPRWDRTRSVRQHIHFDFDGDRMFIDTRRRHG